MCLLSCGWFWVSSSRVPKEREGRERMRVREIEGERGKGEREGKGKGIGEGRRGREKGERNVTNSARELICIMRKGIDC